VMRLSALRKEQRPDNGNGKQENSYVRWELLELETEVGPRLFFRSTGKVPGKRGKKAEGVGDLSAL